jgi:uncharacterized OsmC-like protein/alpha/beta superfamily hydrolase
MREQKITFTNAEGTRLAAVLDLPEDERPLAYALFAHCFTCTKDLAAAFHIARSLSQRRIAVLRFDFAGLGGSEGDFADTTFSSEVGDVVAASRYLADHHQAPCILIGHSLGGAAVLQAAGDIPSTAAVVTLAAPSHPRHLLDLLAGAREEIVRSGQATVTIAGRDFVLKKRFLDDLEAQDAAEKIRRLHAALLVMHSPRDRVVAIENAADIYLAARHPKSFVSLEPADHLLSSAADARYAGEMIATWAGRFLETSPGAAKPPEVIDNRVTARTAAQGFCTDLFVNGHALVADEPESFGGSGRGPSPYDYLLAALGSCTGMTVQMYARRKKWPLAAAVVRLRHEKIHAEDCEHCTEKGSKIDRFERELELRGELSEEQRNRLLEIAEKCPVHRTLHSEVVIDTILRRQP